MRLAPLVPKPKPNTNGKRTKHRMWSAPPNHFAMAAASHKPPQGHGETVLPSISSTPETLTQPPRKPVARAAVGISAKLEVGDVDDPLEREADKLADEVMQMPGPTTDATLPGPLPGPGVPGASSEAGGQAPPPPLADVEVRRACTTCSAEDHEIRRAPASCSAENDPILRVCTSCDSEDDEIWREPGAGLRGGQVSDAFTSQVRSRIQLGGSPLSSGVRNYLEPRLGAGLGGVRFHADTEAGLLARQINARAFTLDHDIFFARGELRPHTQTGMR